MMTLKEHLLAQEKFNAADLGLTYEEYKVRQAAQDIQSKLNKAAIDRKLAEHDKD